MSLTLNLVTSLAFIFLLGLFMELICQRVHIPHIIGLLITGIVLGPCALNLLDDSILNNSAQLRQIALIIILIKAGLSLNIKDLKKVGRPALLMAFLPATFEVIAYTIFAPLLLGISYLEAAVMGAVLAAVSPAVVVPRMVNLMEEKYGTKKAIPQMILAGASLDDVFVIVLFSTFSSMAQGETINAMSFVTIPVSILVGTAVGIVFGFLLSVFFEVKYTHNRYIRNSTKVIFILGTAFLLMGIQEWIKPFVSMSGLLAVMSMATVVQVRCKNPLVINRLSAKFGKLWICAEVLLFVLVGAAVDINYALNAGIGVIIMILLALAIRAIGVCICVAGTKLTFKEKCFCVFSYLPKATVQAAIGSVPLAMGLSCGNIVLTVAVVAIVITAPMGALLMDKTYKKLLVKDDIQE